MVKKIFSIKINNADYKTDELAVADFDVEIVLNVVREALTEQGLSFKAHTIQYVLENGNLYVKGEAYN